MRISHTALAVLLASADAFAGTPGSYSSFKFDDAESLSDVAYTVTVEQDPGSQSAVFWSHQVAFTNGTVAYAGMQTDAGPDRLFLFSVWGATEYKPGSRGSFCIRFDGEGSGISCRMWHVWTPGQPYRFHYESEGRGWFGMTITNLTTGKGFKLGSIKIGADGLKPESTSWVEYYRWSDKRSSCETEPYSRARFEAPVGNRGRLRAHVSGTNKSDCRDHVLVTDNRTYAMHVDAMGNSVMAPITGLAGKCVDVRGGKNASGTPLILYSCHGGANQSWVLAHDGTIHSSLFTCLDASDGDARSKTCNGSAAQQWQIKGTALINPASSKCLDVEGGRSDDGTRLILYECHGGANQQWTFPVRPIAGNQ